MIQITIGKHIYTVSPTIFPDGTIQVWRIDTSFFEKIKCAEVIEIIWCYGNDGELVQLMQVVDLIKANSTAKIYLHLPYLPYARQDKIISNESCFGLNSFAKLINIMGLRS